MYTFVPAWINMFQTCGRYFIWLTLVLVLSPAVDGSTTRPQFESHPPTFTLLPESRYVRVGEVVRLECGGTYRGREADGVTWWGPELQLSIDDVSTRTIVNNSVLLLEITEADFNLSGHAVVSDANVGEFHCSLEFAGSPVQTLSPPIYLRKPIIPDRLSSDPLDLPVHLGDNAAFSCQMEAVPPPVYVWARVHSTTGAKELVSTGPTSRFHVFPVEGVLIVLDVTAEDMGEYACGAVVHREVTLNTTTWSREASLSLSTERQFTISLTPAITFTAEGASVWFFCVSSGSTARQPTVTWYRHIPGEPHTNRTLVASTGSTVAMVPTGKYSLGPGGSLRVSNVRRTDVVEFSCVCRDEATSQTLSPPAVPLKVNYVAELSVEPQNTYGITGETIQIRCSVAGSVNGSPTKKLIGEDGRPATDSGEANADLAWIWDLNLYRTGESKFGASVTDTRLSLRNANAEDSGFYTCSGDNEYGRQYKTVQLIVLPESSRIDLTPDLSTPTGVTVSAIRSQSGDITWTHPQAGDSLDVSSVIQFNVTYWEKGTARRTSQTTSSVTTTIGGLTLGREYMVTVTTFTTALVPSQSQGDPSVPVSFVTYSGAPGECRDIKVTANSTGLTVSWTPPLKIPGLIRYTVLVTQKVAGLLKGNRSTEGDSVSITKLLPSTLYSITVHALNQWGSGPLSPVGGLEKTTKAAEKVAAPEQLLVGSFHQTNISMYWYAPVMGDNSDPDDPYYVKGYKIKWKDRSTNTRFHIRAVDRKVREGLESVGAVSPRVRSYVISGLERDTNFRVCVAVQVSAGVGNYKCTNAAHTLAADLSERVPPPQPTGLLVDGRSNSLFLTWNQEYSSIMVRGFKVLCQKNGEQLGIRFPLVPLRNLYECDGLEPNTPYKVLLHSFNNAGASEQLSKVVHTLPLAAPDPTLPPSTKHEPLLDISTRVLSAYSIQVNWTDFRPIPGVIYTVKYKRLGDHRKDMFVKDVSATSVLIEDLQPYTRYEFSVKTALNGIDSSYSTHVNNWTKEAVMTDTPRELTIAWIDPSGSSSSYNLGRSSQGEQRPLVGPITYDMQASWMEPDRPNGKVLWYEIHYKPVGSAPSDPWGYSLVKGDRLSARIQPLTPDTEYIFRMRAQNSMGWGPFTENLVRKKTRSKDGKMGGGDDYGSDIPSSAPGAGGDGASKNAEQTLWIIIAGGAGVTIIAIVSLIAVLCRKRRTDQQKMGGKSNLKTMNQGVRGQSRRGQQPPDLWIHHEQRAGSTPSSGGDHLPPYHHHAGGDNHHGNSMEMRSMGGMRYEDEEEMDIGDSQPMLLNPHRHHMGGHPSGSRHLADYDSRRPGGGLGTDFDRSVSMGDTVNGGDSSCGGDPPVRYGTLGRKGPTTVIIAPQHQHGGGYREGTPKATVIPLPSQYPTSQQQQQQLPYGGGGGGAVTRVHLGDTSVTPTGFNPDKCHRHPTPAMGTSYSSASPSHQPYAGIPHHAVKPQLVDYQLGDAEMADNEDSPPSPVDPKRLLLPPHSGSPAPDFRSPTPDHHTMKTASTEQLNMEMANLEGIMKDLNAMQNDFAC